MKNTVLLCCGVLALVVASCANAAIYTHSAGLNQGQETGVPAVPNPFGAGAGTFTFDDVTGLFTWDIFYANLTGSIFGAHIHEASPGFNGPVVIDLDKPDPLTPGSLSDPAKVLSAPPPASSGVGGSPFFGTFSGSATLSPAVLAVLTAPVGIGGAIDYYVNFHTPLNPPGEIRGQLVLTSVIPLPAGVWLLVSGLAGIPLMRRRG